MENQGSARAPACARRTRPARPMTNIARANASKRAATTPRRIPTPIVAQANCVNSTARVSMKRKPARRPAILARPASAATPPTTRVRWRAKFTLARPDVETGKDICSFPIPATDGTCPSPYVVFDKRCIVDLPCGGTCSDAQVCNIEIGACEAVPDIPRTDSACDQSYAVEANQSLRRSR